MSGALWFRADFPTRKFRIGYPEQLPSVSYADPLPSLRGCSHKERDHSRRTTLPTEARYNYDHRHVYLAVLAEDKRRRVGGSLPAGRSEQPMPIRTGLLYRVLRSADPWQRSS